MAGNMNEQDSRFVYEPFSATVSTPLLYGFKTPRGKLETTLEIKRTPGQQLEENRVLRKQNTFNEKKGGAQQQN